jgi:hypothetical protein
VRPRLGAAAAIALVLCSAGCGGDEGEPSAQCKAETENAARAAVIAAAYEEGKIGTQAEVDAAFPGDESLFDEDGNMLLYDDLHGLTRARFDEWVANGAYIRGEVQLDANQAMEQVAEDGWPDC